MPDPTGPGLPLRELINMEVPVSVCLCEKLMPLGEVLALRPGTLIRFPQSHDEPLDLYLNESHVGHGYAVDLEESLGFAVEGFDTEARETSLRGAP